VESLAYIRDQPGHHSIKLTVDICGHLVPGPTARLWIGWTTRDATYAQPAARVGENGMTEDKAHGAEKLARVYYRQG
jgi:hypothetical protein